MAGLDPEKTSLELARDVCSMMVATQRIVPASVWVDSLVEKQAAFADAILDSQMDNLFR